MKSSTFVLNGPLSLSLLLGVMILLPAVRLPGQNDPTRREAMLELRLPRRNHSATLLASGRLVLIGGENESGLVSKVEVLDLISRSIVVGSDMIRPRINHTATLLPDGRVLIIGGSDEHGPLDHCEIYDPVTGFFYEGPRLNQARAGHSATTLTDGRILVFGGQPPTAEIFDDSDFEFMVVEAKPSTNRSFHAAVLLQNGEVLLAGGIGEDGEALDTAELFQPREMHFSNTVTPMYNKRVRSTLRVLPSGHVQIIGGDGSATMEMYDPRGRFFRSRTRLIPTAEESLRLSALLSAGTRAAFIGAVDNYEAITKAYTSLSEDHLSAVRELLVRFDHTSTEIPQRNQVVIAGGGDSEGRILRSVFILNSSESSVMTDRIEYLAEWLPTITGTGWYPNERIRIMRLEARANHKRAVLETTADDLGNFHVVGLFPEGQELGVYSLTAVGESSGHVAQTSYRIAPPPDPRIEYTGGPITFRLSSPLSIQEETITRWPAVPRKGLSQERELAAVAGGVALPASTCINLRSVSLCDSNVQFQFVSGEFDLSGSVNGDIRVDLGCPDPTGLICEFRLPDILTNVSVSEALVASMVARITGQGGITLSGPLLPLFNAELELTDNLKLSVAINLILGIGLNLEEASTIEPRFSFNQNVTLRIEGSLSEGLSVVIEGSKKSPLSAGISIIELGQTTLEVFLGPEFKASIGIAICEGSLGFNVDGFISGSINPAQNPPGCFTYQPTLDGGFRAGGSIGLSCEIPVFGQVGVSHSRSVDLLKENILTGTKMIFKDTAPPQINCPSNIVMPTEPGQCTAVVNFRPTATDNCSEVKTLTTSLPSGMRFSRGSTRVTSTATDTWDNSASCNFDVTVIDTEAPVITNVSVEQTVLWPSDHKMREILVSYTSTDNCEVECRLSVTSNEPDEGLGDGDSPNDIEIVDARRVRLRAERSGKGTGRVYTITVTCTDLAGNQSSQNVQVLVPRNR